MDGTKYLDIEDRTYDLIQTMLYMFPPDHFVHVQGHKIRLRNVSLEKPPGPEQLPLTS